MNRRSQTLARLEVLSRRDPLLAFTSPCANLIVFLTSIFTRIQTLTCSKLRFRTKFRGHQEGKKKVVVRNGVVRNLPLTMFAHTSSIIQIYQA
jgi:hypothetical protein